MTKFSIFKVSEQKEHLVTLDITRINGGDKNERYYLRKLVTALSRELKTDIEWVDEDGNKGGIDRGIDIFLQKG